MKKLTQQQVDGMLAHFKLGTPNKKIAEELKLNENTVWRWKKRFGKGESTALDKPLVGNIPEKKKYQKQGVKSLIVNIIKQKLDSDPKFLGEVVKLMDFEELIAAELKASP